MANAELTPMEQIGQHIETKENFVLNGGAGSGKTYTLMEVLDLIYKVNPKSKVACITFTNVASDEISERGEGGNMDLRASTIHDFLWDIIKNYQKNLKKALLELIKEGVISYRGEEELSEECFQDKTIEYREWTKLEKGIVSHNEVLSLANRLFKDFPLLGKILGDRYDYIFIDEYQDTEPQVIEIFLEHIQSVDNAPIVGLFGDSMQAIYEKGVGDVRQYIEAGIIKEVKKGDNWRCAKNVISLINQIRDDGLEQQAAGGNVDGKITFLYSNASSIDIQEIKSHPVFSEFNFDDYEQNKELYLTHRLIAKQFGFENLLTNYRYRDSLTGDSPDPFISHLLKIQEITFLYQQRKFNEFIKKTDFKVRKNNDLQVLRQNIDELIASGNKTIEEVIDLADSLQLVIKDDRLQKFITEKEEHYNKVKDIFYGEIISLYDYRDEHSPYSTQHGVKGAEFQNVFVILDNGKWNKYNFEYLFENRSDKESIVNRTRKIFYVCCSRAENHLVVFFHKPSIQSLAKAREWFGESNVIEI